MNIITHQEAIEKVLEVKNTGRVFSITFPRRTDRKDGSAKKGDLTTCSVRGGVTKGVTGKGMSYNPADHDRLSGFYKMANGEQKHHMSLPARPGEIKQLKIEGIVYEVAI